MSKTASAILDILFSDEPAPSRFPKTNAGRQISAPDGKGSHPDIRSLRHGARELSHHQSRTHSNCNFHCFPRNNTSPRWSLPSSSCSKFTARTCSPARGGISWSRLWPADGPVSRKTRDHPCPKGGPCRGMHPGTAPSWPTRAGCPANVFSRFGEYDAIDRALLIRRQRHGASSQAFGVSAGHKRALEGWDPGSKGKEREDDVWDSDVAALKIWHIRGTKG